MYPPFQEKQAITAQTDPQKRNLVGFIIYILRVKNLYLGEQPGSAQTHTSAHTSTWGEGVAMQWAVFVYIYKTPL